MTSGCHDHDPFTRMSAQHGIRLRPDSSVVEVVVRLHNRSSERQSFLWWANVAARVHEDYQSFFPEDVRYVADHARRALTAFPAADRPYYHVDYPPRGTSFKPHLGAGGRSRRPPWARHASNGRHLPRSGKMDTWTTSPRACRTCCSSRGNSGPGSLQLLWGGTHRGNGCFFSNSDRSVLRCMTRWSSGPLS